MKKMCGNVTCIIFLLSFVTLFSFFKSFKEMLLLIVFFLLLPISAIFFFFLANKLWSFVFAIVLCIVLLK